MRAFVDYMRSTSKDLVPAPGLGDWYDYGHGQNLGESRFTPTDLSAMACFHECALTVGRAAQVLGKQSDKSAYEKLPADLQVIVSEAARSAALDMMDDYTFNNAKALPVLLEQGTVLKRFPDAVLAALRETSAQVLNEVAAQSDLNTRIHASQEAFLSKMRETMQITEKELYNWR